MTHLGSGSSSEKRGKKTDIFPLLRQLNLDSAKLHCFGFISFLFFLNPLILPLPVQTLFVHTRKKFGRLSKHFRIHCLTFPIAALENQGMFSFYASKKNSQLSRQPVEAVLECELFYSSSSFFFSLVCLYWGRTAAFSRQIR